MAKHIKLNWAVSPQVESLVTAIVARAVKDSPIKIDRMSLEMDLIAAHNNGCPLRFEDLLEAKPFDFAHDIVGIQRNMNRRTGKLENCFLPRFYDPIPAVTKKAKAAKS